MAQCKKRISVSTDIVNAGCVDLTKVEKTAFHNKLRLKYQGKIFRYWNLTWASPKHVLPKNVIFKIFLLSQRLKPVFVYQGRYWEKGNSLGVRAMVAHIRPRLARNIFTAIVVSLLTVQFRFSQLRLRHFISATKIRYWWVSVFYRALKLWLYFT